MRVGRTEAAGLAPLHEPNHPGTTKLFNRFNLRQDANSPELLIGSEVIPCPGFLEFKWDEPPGCSI